MAPRPQGPWRRTSSEQRLRRFFDGPRNFWSHVVESGRTRRRMLNEMDDLKRYLDGREQEILEQMRLLGYL